MSFFAIYIFILLFSFLILRINKQLGCLTAGDEVVIVY